LLGRQEILEPLPRQIGRQFIAAAAAAGVPAHGCFGYCWLGCAGCWGFLGRRVKERQLRGIALLAPRAVPLPQELGQVVLDLGELARQVGIRLRELLDHRMTQAHVLRERRRRSFLAHACKTREPAKLFCRRVKIFQADCRS
jgi:hypothetical protein